MSASLNICLQRNEDYAATWVFTDGDDVPIDLSDIDVALEVRDKLTQDLVAAADIEITDAPAGEVTVILRASEGSPLSAYGAAIQTANLHYDMRLTDTDGVHLIVVSGIVILSRGETRA
jgi:hypothetical protein